MNIKGNVCKLYSLTSYVQYPPSYDTTLPLPKSERNNYNVKRK